MQRLTVGISDYFKCTPENFLATPEFAHPWKNPASIHDKPLFRKSKKKTYQIESEYTMY